MLPALTSPYSRDALCALNHERLPSRCIRKVLFRRQLWALSAVHHVTRWKVDINNMVRVSFRHQPCQRLRTSWLNVQSLGNKTTTMCAEIVDRQLDIAMLSETWHCSTGSTHPSGNAATLHCCQRRPPVRSQPRWPGDHLA